MLSTFGAPLLQHVRTCNAYQNVSKLDAFPLHKVLYSFVLIFFCVGLDVRDKTYNGMSLCLLLLFITLSPQIKWNGSPTHSHLYSYSFRSFAFKGNVGSFHRTDFYSLFISWNFIFVRETPFLSIYWTLH